MPLSGGENSSVFLDRCVFLCDKFRVFGRRTTKLLANFVNSPRLAVIADIAATAAGSASRLACRALICVPNLLSTARFCMVLVDSLILGRALIDLFSLLIDAGQIIQLNLVELVAFPDSIIIWRRALLLIRGEPGHMRTVGATF